jgi:hypothetical protein
MGRACSSKGEKRSAYGVFLMGKTEGNRPLGRPRRRWEDNVKVDGVVWTILFWFRIGTSGGLL